MTGPCAKAVVRCTIVGIDGIHYVGENACNNPQTTCPRAPGEDYTKCSTICDQVGHAEMVALFKAREKAVGGHAYIEYSHACKECQIGLFKAGIKALSLGPPPEPAVISSKR